MQSGCPTENTLQEFVQGCLPAPARQALMEHLDGCEDCRGLVAALVDETDPARSAEPPKLAGYRVVRVLGAGGVGTVYEAIQESLQRRVAIKVLHPRYAQEKDLKRRLFQEARAVNLIGHPGVIGVSEHGELSDGSGYLVMEYLDGETLDQRYRRLWRGGEVSAGLGLLRQVAVALTAAHHKGITHRDLKPGNVMVLADAEAPGGERAKVLDFGLAKLAQEKDLRTTRSGTLMGTPLYMAPEQCRGARDVDGQADVYALGVMLYELWAQRPPFLGSGAGEVLAKHIYEPAPPLPNVAAAPPALAALIRAMLSKDPAARPTMAQVAERLRAEGSRLPGGRLARFWQRSLPKWSWFAGSALLLAAVGLWSTLRPQRPDMVRLSGGDFVMGSTPDEVEDAYAFCVRLLGSRCTREFYERELPARKITLSPFFLDTTEVTNQQYAAWLDKQPDLQVEEYLVHRGSKLLLDLYPSYGLGGLVYEGGPAGAASDQVRPGPRAKQGRFQVRAGLERWPVVQVFWDGAVQYCQDQGKQLPSEAQWEFAARSGQAGRRFPWGDAPPRCEGVLFGRIHDRPCQAYSALLAPVGSSPQDRSRDGVLDLGGSVSEWVLDALVAPYPDCGSCLDPVASTARDNAPDNAPDNTVDRIARGGSFTSTWESLRTSGRIRWPADKASGNIGFRCARSAR